MLTCIIGTQKLTLYKFEHEGYDVTLIDTPGFNDTFRTDADILKEIAQWLEFAYTKELRLAGIIYLHRIADVRMEGSALKNLKMFRKLCGDEPLKNVLLATSFWENVDAEVGNRREKELISVPEFWGDMVEYGSKVVRFNGSARSALDIVKQFFDRATITLKIQDELVNEGKKLVDTAAGSTLNEELLALQKKHSDELKRVEEDMREAIADKDEQLKKILEKEQKRLDRQLQRFRDEQDQLRADRRKQMLALDQEWEARIRQYQEDAERQRILEKRANEEQLALHKAEIEGLKQAQVPNSDSNPEYTNRLHEQELRILREQFKATQQELEQLRLRYERQGGYGGQHGDVNGGKNTFKKRKSGIGKMAFEVGMGAAGLAGTMFLGPLATPLTTVLSDFINSM
jgi:hypothetical protein